ncbi:gap junction delta-4 protein-like [Python bivittatus]|uniref:Gap junction delta-4 protein-like n=1 Tax=Python bivittatus TaxID=176946 RepID=A0A9F2RF02_PYTBI|nr:gap junction delta-4 protein-like [Python bivittatus]
MSSDMKHWDLFTFSFLLLNYNVTIMGKIWLILILMRLTVILLGPYPLYEDELGAFECNTQQRGCTSMCYDAFAGVSQVRFWLLELILMLLPFAVFAIYILHSVVKQVVEVYSLPCSYCKQAKVSAGFTVTEIASDDTTRTRITCGAHELAIPDFSQTYTVQLLLRMIIESGFRIGNLKYNSFGFFVEKLYKCNVDPCPNQVECFVPRSTEKSAMIIVLWIVSGFSLLLGFVDLFLVARSHRNKLGEISMEEKCRISMHQQGEPSRVLSNLGNADVSEDCGNVPMESYQKECHPAKDNTL